MLDAQDCAHALIIVGELLGIPQDEVNADITEDTGLTNYDELREQVRNNEVTDNALAAIAIADFKVGGGRIDAIVRARLGVV